MSSIEQDMLDECEMLLMDYARGALNDAQRVLVASYLEMSELARHRAAMFECLGGALMESCCDPVAMMEDSLQAVMDRLENCSVEASCATAYERRHRVEIPLPRALCMEISVRCGPAASWRRAGMGVRIMRIPDPGCSMLIMRMNPGARLPRHRHDAREITLVLDGTLEDAGGRHRRGDILIMDPGTVHAPHASADQGCTCLIVSESGHAAMVPWVMRLFGRV